MLVIRWAFGLLFGLVLFSLVIEGKALTALGIVGACLLIGAIRLIIFLVWRSGRRSVNRTLTLPRRVGRTRDQDRFAQGLLKRLREETETPKFVLYLRAFEFDQRSAVRVRYDEFDSYVTTVEAMLVEALNEKMPVIGIGFRVGADRPGMVERPDEEWQETFDLLAERATVICVVPLMRPGVRWEMNRLVGLGLMEKICLLIPPTDVVPGSRIRMRESLVTLQELGYRLPMIGDKGGVLQVSGEGITRYYEPFPQDEKQMATDLQRLFPLHF